MMKKSILSFILVITISGLSACGFLQSKPQHLLTSTSDASTLVAQQQWQLHYQQERFLLEVIAERHADHWQWILISNLGQRLATATGKQGVITIERHQSHPALALLPELLEAWQFSFWPLSDLQQSMPNWQFTDNLQHREVSFSGILRATIDYQHNSLGNPWQSRLTYDNKKHIFQLTIESQLLN